MSRPPRKKTKTEMTTAEKADEALKIAKIAKKIAGNQEIKVVGGYTDQTTFTNNGQIVRLNSIAQGVGDNQRVADKITMKTLSIRMLVRGTVEDVVRVMIVYAPQSKITVPGDICESAGNAFGFLSFKPYDKRSWSKVLYDQTFPVDDISTSGLVYYVNENIPINRVTQYDAGTTTINTGDLWVLFIHRGSVNTSNVYFGYRLYYSDS